MIRRTNPDGSVTFASSLKAIATLDELQGRTRLAGSREGKARRRAMNQAMDRRTPLLERVIWWLRGWKWSATK